MLGGTEGPLGDIVRRIVREEMDRVHKKLDTILAKMGTTVNETIVISEETAKESFEHAFKEIEKQGTSIIAEPTAEDIAKEISLANKKRV